VGFVLFSCLVLLSVFCLFVFAYWARPGVDLLLFLSLWCLNGGCGLRDTHGGRWQPVSDSFDCGSVFPLAGCCDL